MVLLFVTSVRLLGPPGLWRRSWVGWPSLGTSEADIAAWPYSVGSLIKLVGFLSSRWSGGFLDLGLEGVMAVSYVGALSGKMGQRSRTDCQHDPKNGKNIWEEGGCSGRLECFNRMPFPVLPHIVSSAACYSECLVENFQI